MSEGSDTEEQWPEWFTVMVVIVLICLIAQRLGPVVLLSVAGAMAEFVGLAIIARWVRPTWRPGPNVQRRRGNMTVPLPMAVEANGAATIGLKVTRAGETEETLRDATDRHDREIAQLREELYESRRATADLQTGLNRVRESGLRDIAQTLEVRLRDPELGVFFVVVGILLSAAANVVGAYPF